MTVRSSESLPVNSGLNPAPREFVWANVPMKTPASRRRHSRRACLPDQGRGGHREGAPPARHGGWGARATWRYSRCDSYRDSCRNSVHKCPKTARRGHSRRSVYTPASPRPSATAPQPNSVHKRPKTAPRGPILPFVYTIAIPRPPTTQAHGPTVYTNAPKRLRGAILADLCTLLRPHNCTRDRAGLLVPRRRRPHGPRDARALGPEAHAAKAVAQPPTHTNSRSLL